MDAMSRYSEWSTLHIRMYARELEPLAEEAKRAGISVPKVAAAFLRQAMAEGWRVDSVPGSVTVVKDPVP
jgi:hypothetical protein